MWRRESEHFTLSERDVNAIPAVWAALRRGAAPPARVAAAASRLEWPFAIVVKDGGDGCAPLPEAWALRASTGGCGGLTLALHTCVSRRWADRVQDVPPAGVRM